MKKSVATLFFLIALQCGLGGTATAQSNNICTTIRNIAFVWVPVGFNCVPWGGFIFLDTCTFPNTICAPGPGPSECPTCCPTSGSAGSGSGGGPMPPGSTAVAGSPICLTTGDTYIDQADIRIPGLSGGLALTRRWNSQWPVSQMASQVGLFGPNWRSTYEERVFLGSDGYMRYARGDGNFWSFGVGGPGWAVVVPGYGGATLVQGNSYWSLTLKNGEQRRFDINSGSLTAIIDRNGNTTQLTYDSLNRLITVTDPVSRHLTFTYASNTSFLITGVSSDVGGLSLTYAYDSQNRLSQVTKPDQTTLTFQYDSNSMITAVLDSSGKVLESHTYDSSHRGLTSSRAGGVEALTISY